MQELGVMEGVLPEADMARWVAARSKPKYAALMLTCLVRQVGALPLAIAPPSKPPPPPPSPPIHQDGMATWQGVAGEYGGEVVGT